MTADATTSDNEVTDKTLRNQLVAVAGWLGGWALVCAALFSLRIGKIWNLVGGSWLGMFTAYVALFFGGAIIVFTFTKKRTKNPFMNWHNICTL